MINSKVGISPNDMCTVEIEKGVFAFIVGDHQETMRKVQILRAAPKLLELVSRFVSAEQEERQAIGKRVRAKHEAEDLLKTLNVFRGDKA